MADAVNTMKKMMISSGAVKIRVGAKRFNRPFMTKTTSMKGKSAAMGMWVMER